MPILVADREQVQLSPGRHELGGEAPGAVRLGALVTYPVAGTISVAHDGRATVQRLTSRVALRVNDMMLGATPVTIGEDATIQVGDVRMTYRLEADPEVQPPAPADAPRQSQLATQVMVALKPSGASGVLVSLVTGAVTRLSTDAKVIGRSEDADIVVMGDGISRRHATVALEGESYVLRDESTNGTFVNGARIAAPTTLRPGDVVAVGGRHFRFGTGAAAVASLTPGALALARVEIANDRQAQRTHVIDRPVCTIGRGAHNDLRLEHDSVSGSHATLLLKGETWFVTDLCSTAGTYVDGYRIAGERPLAGGSVIRLGEVTMTFKPGSARPAPPAARPGRSMLQRVAHALFERPRGRAGEAGRRSR